MRGGVGIFLWTMYFLLDIYGKGVKNLEKIILRNIRMHPNLLKDHRSLEENYYRHWGITNFQFSIKFHAEHNRPTL